MVHPTSQNHSVGSPSQQCRACRRSPSSSLSRPQSQGQRRQGREQRQRRAFSGAATLLACSLFLLALSASPAAAKDNSQANFDCKSVKVGKKTYDLSHIPFPVSISSEQDTPPTRTTSQLHIDLCEALSTDSHSPSADQCPSGTRACLQLINSKQGESDRIVQAIPVVAPAASEDGEVDASGSISYEVEEGSELVNGQREWRLELSGAKYGGGKKQSTIIDFKCDRNAAKDAAPTWRHYDARDGELKLNWSTRYACTDAGDDDGEGGSSPEPGDGSGNQSGQKGGWGFFSWFFFLLFLGFGIYFVLGTYNNYTQFGVMEIPHKEFWRESPYLVKDVAQQAVRSVSGNRGTAGRGDYEAL